jgi:circadian clock protein KaiB
MSALVMFEFRLYVVGDAPNSLLAAANLDALCREHLADRHRIEIVDILLDPGRALSDGILLTPTLIKLKPEPVRKIVGTLSDTGPMLQTLGIAG